MSQNPISPTIDLTTSGHHIGHLRIPRSHNLGGWSSQVISIASIRNGAGPTVLVLAGNHGDEYEGQLAALRFVRDVDLEAIAGQIVVIPCLSPDASRAGTRLWPDGTNFNRVFPGRPDGTVAEMLADYLTTTLFPFVDIVVDMHSGGRSQLFAPMSHMHRVADLEQCRAMAAGMLAWNSPFHMLYTDVAGSGLLPNEAERQKKIVVTTELGGGGIVTEATLALATAGLNNVLRHFGVLDGPVTTRAEQGLEPSVVIDATDPSAYYSSPDDGLFEPVCFPGDSVSAGTPVGRLHFPQRLDRPSEDVIARTDGVVATIRNFPPVSQGDGVAVVGTPINENEIV